MATKEIITLQLGHYANFIGTHWWNIQESTFKYDKVPKDEKKKEINHDILYREGQTRHGEVTFCPRLILAELKGGVSCLKPFDDLYENANTEIDELLWDGTVAVHKQQVKRKTRNIFSNHLETEECCNNGNDKEITDYYMEPQIDVWSDYLRPCLHSKSMTVIKEYSHNSKNNPFDLWMKGTDLNNVCDELKENIRFYAEECDHLQGFHVISDSNNGFSGLSSAILSYLSDEFSAKHSVVFPVMPANFAEDATKRERQKQELTCSLGLSTLLEHSSVICPLSLPSEPSLTPHLIYDASLNYHTSAILACALETATLTHRLKNTHANLDQFCSSITSASKNIVSMSLLLPVPLYNCLENTRFQTSPPRFFDLLQTNFLADNWTEISPCMDDHSFNSHEYRYYAQMLSLRGVPLTNWKSLCEENRTNEMLLFYLNQRFSGCKNSAFNFDEPLPTQIPFPQIFSERIGVDGFLKPTASENFSTAEAWFPENVNTEPFNSLNNTTNHNNHHEDCLIQLHNNGDAEYHTMKQKNYKTTKRGMLPSKLARVRSVPVMTNMTCSSKTEQYLSVAASSLQKGKNKHFMLHGMELENIDYEIERLLTFRDEYKASDHSNQND